MKRRNEELVISRPQDVSFGTIRMQLLLSSALIFLIGGGKDDSNDSQILWPAAVGEVQNQNQNQKFI